MVNFDKLQSNILKDMAVQPAVILKRVITLEVIRKILLKGLKNYEVIYMIIQK